MVSDKRIPQAMRNVKAKTKLVPHPCEATVRALRINVHAIARAYGCDGSFVWNILAGRCTCPPKLDTMIRRTVAARRTEITRHLDAHPVAAS